MAHLVMTQKKIGGILEWQHNREEQVAGIPISNCEVNNFEPHPLHCECHSILEMTLLVWKMTILTAPLGSFLTSHLSKCHKSQFGGKENSQRHPPVFAYPLFPYQWISSIRRISVSFFRIKIVHPKKSHGLFQHQAWKASQHVVRSGGF